MHFIPSPQAWLEDVHAVDTVRMLSNCCTSSAKNNVGASGRVLQKERVFSICANSSNDGRVASDPVNPHSQLRY